MKTSLIKKMSLLLISAMLVFVFSCKEEAGLQPNVEEQQYGNLMPDDNFAVDNDLNDADLDELFAMLEVEGGCCEAKTECGRNQNNNPRCQQKCQNHCNKHFNKRKAFEEMLKSLQLSEEQRKQFDAATREHQQCRMKHMEMLRKLNQDIMKKYQDKRIALITAFRNGRITEEQLKKELLKLRDEMKKEIQENPQRKKIMIALQNCFDEYMKKVRRILDDRQWEIWIKWHKQHQR